MVSTQSIIRILKNNNAFYLQFSISQWNVNIVNMQLSIMLSFSKFHSVRLQHTQWGKVSVGGWWAGVHSGVWGCIPCSAIPHPQCVSLLWPQQCEFDEWSALLNHWNSVWEAALPASNGHCSTPLTHDHTHAQSTIVKAHTGLGLIYECVLNSDAL